MVEHVVDQTGREKPARADWRECALAGRPVFLLYVHAGTADWSDLWAFFSEQQSEPCGLPALMGLFHTLQSRRQDCDGGAYEGSNSQAALRQWAQFVTEHEELITEERLRDDLAGLLAAGLIETRYFTRVFEVYLEARVAHHMPDALTETDPSPHGWGGGYPGPHGHMPIRWPVRLNHTPFLRDEPWFGSFSQLLERHYSAWNWAYCRALDRGEQVCEAA